MKNRPAIISALLLTLLFGGVLFHNTAFAEDFNASSTLNLRALQASPDTPNGEENLFYISRESSANHLQRSYLRFDVSSSTEAIGSATLNIWYASWGTNNPVGKEIKFYELTQPAWDVNLTWNKYNGINSWITAGGDYTITGGCTIVLPDIEAGVGQWITCDVKDIVNDSIANHSGIVNLILRFGDESTSFETYAVFDGHYYESYAPHIVGSSPATSISFVYPENGTTTPSFDNFIMDWTIDPALDSGDEITLIYGKNLSACENFNAGMGCYATGKLIEGFDGENELLPQPINLTTGTYQAEAYLYNGTNNLVASSSISFYVESEFLPDYWDLLPTSTWSTSTLPVQITCDPTDNLFQYSLCKLGTFLFLPSQDSLDRFSDLKDQISAKVPFGYLPLIQDAYEGLSTTTPAFALATSTALTESIFTPIRTGLTFIIWIMFVLLLFNRIKHFEL